MKIKKDSIIKITISIILAFVLASIFFLKAKNATIVFFVEVFILLVFFNVIIFDAKDRFNPFSFFLLTLFLGVMDIIFVVDNIRIVVNKYDISIYEKSLFIIILWLFGFLLGYFIKFYKKNKMSLKISKTVNRYIEKADINKLLLIGLAIQSLLILVIIKTIVEVGGIKMAINDFSVFRYKNQGYLASILPLISIVTIAFLERKNKKLAIISMIINFALITLTGRRGIAINTVIIPVLVFYNYRVKKINNKTIFIIGIPIIAFILIIGNLRNQNVSLNNKNSSILNIAASITNTIQYGQNIPDLLYSIETKKVEFQGGKYLLNGVLGMIPRAVWNNKPEIDHSLITSKLVYYSDISYGKPVGAFGFAYLCFGYIGVIISGIITGKATSMLYNWLKNNKNTIVILIYAITVQSVLVITNPEAQVKIITLTITLIILSILSISKTKNEENYIKNDKDKKINKIYNTSKWNHNLFSK